MKSVLYIIAGFLLALPFCGSGQQLQRIENAPSNEVYDLLVDKKGFLWVTHDLGISRYDGISFTSFTNEEQSSISMTDLIEDNYGRIWCHNFNSQVFYIEHDKMHYLKEYNFKQESVFPRMVLLGDELVITSNRGLFFCNTTNLKCRYVTNPTLLYYEKNYGSIGISSICVLKNKVLTLNDQDSAMWGICGLDGKLKTLKYPAFTRYDKIRRYLKLEPYSCGDTAFIVNNTEGLLYGVVVRNDSVIPVLQRKAPAHINTIDVVNNKVWVNTNRGSFGLHDQDTIFNDNQSAVAESKDGYRWFGSLSTGLLTYAKNTGWSITQQGLLSVKDYICSSVKYNNWFLLCSNLGDIFMFDKGKDSFSRIATIPLIKGSPTNIQHLFGSNFLIEAKKGLYIIDADTKKVWLADSQTASKSILLHKNIGYFAYASGFAVIDARGWGLKLPDTVPLSSFSNNIFWKSIWVINNTRTTLKQNRCRALLYDSSSNTILAAFSDGLFRVLKDTLKPILYHNQPLYVSSLVNYGNKIYAGSFNKGLFLIKDKVVTKIFTDAELSRDAIVKLKQCNNHIWVFGTHNMALLDAITDTFVRDMCPLPININDVTDVDENDNNIYLTTHKGIFLQFRNQKYQIAKTNPHLLYVVINNSDTVFGNNLSLANNKNNLLFRLAIPVYTNPERVHFKYRLYHGNALDEDSIWYYTHDAQRDLQFLAIKPGNYTLEIIAVQDNEVISTSPLVYNFTINRPWYATWIFYLAVALVIISATIAIQQYRLRQILKIERVRRKIASDLHDDIGSTLSSINVYSEIARKEDDNMEYIATIQQNTVGIINSLDDLVWNINPKNDVLENMVARMRQFAEPLLAEKGIDCAFNIDADNLHASITPDVRTNIYLLFKEAVNNTVKHSGSTTCNINILQRGRSFTLTVADNGKGFDSKLINKHRNGLHNMQQRAADIKGQLAIYSDRGQGTVITLSCNLK